MRIADTTAELMGHTLRVKLNRIAVGSDASIASKLEYFNPAHSMKGRIGL